MESEYSQLNKPLDEVIKEEKNYKYPKKKYEGEGTVNKKKVFVGNLSYETDWKILKDHMKSAGNVVYADIFSDRSGRSKGCGLVEFETEEEAKNALETLNQSKLEGRNIFLREDKPKPEDGGNHRDKHNKYQEDRPRSRSGYKEKQDNRYERGDKGDRYRGDREERGERPERREYEKKEYKDYPKRDTKGMKGVKVDVRNLPYSVSWQTLKDEFKEFGFIIRADVYSDESGRSKGNGYIIFENENSANDAIDAMNNRNFHGREIRVEMGKSKY